MEIFLQRLYRKNETVEGISEEAVKAVLNSAFESIISEISRSFDYFRDTTNYENIDGIIVSGGVALTQDFALMLSERIGINVNAAEPFKNIEIPDTFDREYLEKVAPHVSIAVGLALRREGDK